MNRDELRELRLFATRIRQEVIRMIGTAGSGHPGGSLSIVDILTVLYRKILRHEPNASSFENSDRFILSKGHAAPALYAVLAYCGFFPRELLSEFRSFGSILQGHPDCKRTPGIEISTGSLGQGLSIAGGMALGSRLRKLDTRIYVLLGDGEIQEGQVWEAAMAISHYKLGNITAIIDNNGLQIDGRIEEIMNVYPIDAKFSAFGWEVLKTDGHDLERIFSALKESMVIRKRPTVIIAKTTKGKGVSFMENEVSYHHSKNLGRDLQQLALCELEKNVEEITNEK